MKEIAENTYFLNNGLYDLDDNIKNYWFYIMD